MERGRGWLCSGGLRGPAQGHYWGAAEPKPKKQKDGLWNRTGYSPVYKTMCLKWAWDFYFLFYFCKDFIHLLLERGEGREKERETSVCERYIDQLPLTPPPSGVWPATQTSALTRNRTGNPLVRRWALNPLSHTTLAWVFYRMFF